MSDYATDVAKAAFRAGFLQSTEAFNAEYVGPDKLSGEAKWSELMGWAGLLAIIDGGPSPAPAWWVNVKNEFTFRHDTSAYDYPVYPAGELRPLYTESVAIHWTVPGGYPWRISPHEWTEAFTAALRAVHRAHAEGEGPYGVFIARHEAIIAAPAAQQTTVPAHRQVDLDWCIEHGMSRPNTAAVMTSLRAMLSAALAPVERQEGRAA